jgi:hypothetical protein
LSIIRLRSDAITQEEVAYYFISLALGSINGLRLPAWWIGPFAARGRVRAADLVGDEVYPLVELTRPPVIRWLALCLPLTEREPLSLRGSRVAEHHRMEVRGRQRERDPACG